ncbi:MAG: T9SS type A sorting domain-containing protein [Bacteroidota bacterium]|nr:T9SS type A sorting domain-containing protein [Bacteroidota bacterium]
MKKKSLQFIYVFIALLFSINLYAQTATDLFFSEYSEGSSNNKYLEIFNGTGSQVDLTNYAILTNYNGNSWTGIHKFPASSTLDNDSVWVIGNSSADAIITDASDETFAYNASGYIVGFNGDDVRCLVEIVTTGATDTFIDGTDTNYCKRVDIIGRLDLVDPGSGWAVAGIADATKDHTLVRKATVMAPNTCWDCAAGTDEATSEWIVLNKDTWTEIGKHSMETPTPPPAPPVYNIEDVTGIDSAGMPDSLGVVCYVEGIVHSINYQAYKPGLSFVIHNGTDGIWVYNYKGTFGYDVRMGDKIKVCGEIDQYKGLLEIAPDSIFLVDSNQTLNTPLEITALDETNEAELIKLKMVWVADTSQWPSPTDYAVNVDVTNGTDTFTMRIPTDCNVHNAVVRLDTFHLIGVVGQYDGSSPYLEGYQIFPRNIDDLIHFDIISIDRNSFSDNFKVYPNPNNGNFVLENNSKSEVEISVINTIGKTIYKNQSSSSRININLENAQSGIYFVRVTNVNNQKAVTGNILVK